jgi:hypothetical protein
VTTTTSQQIGPAYLAGLDRARRRRAGAYYTPAPVAAGLTRLALRGALGSTTVADLAVGGGAFLLAAAEALAGVGLGRRHVVEELLWGVDLDAGAVAACRRALVAWAAEGGEVADPRHVLVGDGLRGRAAWPDSPAEGFGAVVGNPPFQSQLGRETARGPDGLAALREHYGEIVKPYVDTAALFLVAATRSVAPGGRIALVLPESVLAARDAGPARAAALDSCHVTAFWWAGAQVFDAVVDVCAPVLTRGGAAPVEVQRFSGPAVTDAAPVHVDPAALAAGRSWASLLTPEGTIPQLELGDVGTLGDFATATAGFREQFYGIADHVREAGSHASDAARPCARLVTVGLVDPMRCRWGVAGARFAGQRWVEPVVDLVSLHDADERLARWGDERLVPKVVLATQTRVLEPAVDLDGSWWPSVPTIAVVPRGEADADLLWSIAAVLAAPPVSAWALEHHRGAALARDAIKLAASQVLAIPLPPDRVAWDAGAAAAARAQRGAAVGDAEAWREALVEVGHAMTRAYRAPSAVLDWWLDRLPPWR